ncbi:hypothetical protein CAEBREN_14548 [Caenorhabditis brenneri]|uniref:Uncharacterized protein n=1 Tax=Caenorhabditis brenneri TaxID=135651 RepID=G0N0D8_CAEBE|nr:hypothetical protein CAEBREN_14548 [Caenorhabditis brenneri]
MSDDTRSSQRCHAPHKWSELRRHHRHNRRIRTPLSHQIHKSIPDTLHLKRRVTPKTVSSRHTTEKTTCLQSQARKPFPRMKIPVIVPTRADTETAGDRVMRADPRPKEASSNKSVTSVRTDAPGHPNQPYRADPVYPSKRNDDYSKHTRRPTIVANVPSTHHEEHVYPSPHSARSATRTPSTSHA